MDSIFNDGGCWEVDSLMTHALCESFPLEVSEILNIIVLVLFTYCLGTE